MISFDIIGNYGRLGNQMFQYAALYNTAMYNGYKFGIPYKNEKPTYFVNGPDGSFRYGLELHKCFNITALDSSDELQPYKYTQMDFAYNPSILNIRNNTTLIGYFQSEKYFKEYKDFLLKEFTFKSDILLDAMEIYYGLKTKYHTPLVFIHVRRGDYLKMQDHHPILDVEYYKKASTYFKDIDPHYVVFSDDIEYTKKMFNGLFDKISYIHKGTFLDLCLMSMCDHAIIANSSYSWWGAYLQKNKDHIVVAPYKWFGERHNDLNVKDLIPETWVKI